MECLDLVKTFEGWKMRNENQQNEINEAWNQISRKVVRKVALDLTSNSLWKWNQRSRMKMIVKKDISNPSKSLTYQDNSIQLQRWSQFLHPIPQSSKIHHLDFKRASDDFFFSETLECHRSLGRQVTITIPENSQVSCSYFLEIGCSRTFLTPKCIKFWYSSS